MAINSFGGGGASLTVTGNARGLVAKNGSQLVARDLIGIYPIIAPNEDGTDGPIVFTSASQRILAAGIVNGAITTDQSLQVIGAETFIIRDVVFTAASAIPDPAMAGGVYTASGKGGQILVMANNTFAALTTNLKVRRVAVDTGEISQAPFIYFSLTTANPSPITLAVYVIGDVLKYASA